MLGVSWCRVSRLFVFMIVPFVAVEVLEYVLIVKILVAYRLTRIECKVNKKVVRQGESVQTEMSENAMIEGEYIFSFET